MALPGAGKVVIKGVAAPPPGKGIRVDANGQDVAVFNIGGSLYGIDADCTHAGGPLDEGTVTEHRVECPWHGSVFDVDTGKVLRSPARAPVRAYRVYLEAEGLVLEPRPMDSGVPSGH